MTQGMYQGRVPFDREQLVFIVEAAIASVLDKIDGCLPQTTSAEDWEQRQEEFRSYCHGAESTFGIFVPILWAQTEGQRVGDGMGTCDFVGWEDFEKLCDKFIADHTTKPYRKSIKWPTNKKRRLLAEKIVDAAWSEYLSVDHNLTSEGYEISEDCLVEWPDDDGMIRIRDQHGNCVSTVEMPTNTVEKGGEADRWHELRNLFPDDALYFQPEGAGDHDDEELPESVRKMASFQVYRSYTACCEAHPDADILGYTGPDIEQPTFMDVEKPIFWWDENKPDA